MACRSLVYGFVVASMGLVSSFPGRVQADPVTLASASFEEDSAGAVARPGGSEETPVLENVWEHSTSSVGCSKVVNFGLTKRYRLNDIDGAGARGIRLPFDSEVSSGGVTIEAVVSAEQGGADGGACTVDRPDKEGWLGRTAFGADGHFSVHGFATTAAYSPNVRYRVRMTVHFGQTPSVDYRITEAATGVLVHESDGRCIEPDAVAGAITFRTDEAGLGGFTVDEMSAVQ